VVINNVLKCDLQTSFDDEGKLAKRTFGIVRRIDFSSDIRLDVNPQTVMTILGADTITFPIQPLSAAIVMGTSKGKERVLPISMNINPVFTKTGDICDLKFVEFEPNISDLSSPNLPKWISKGAEKFLNNNRRLKNKMLKLANDAAIKIRAKICGQ